MRVHGGCLQQSLGKTLRVPIAWEWSLAEGELSITVNRLFQQIQKYLDDQSARPTGANVSRSTCHQTFFSDESTLCSLRLIVQLTFKLKHQEHLNASNAFSLYTIQVFSYWQIIFVSLSLSW